MVALLYVCRLESAAYPASPNQIYQAYPVSLPKNLTNADELCG